MAHVAALAHGGEHHAALDLVERLLAGAPPCFRCEARSWSSVERSGSNELVRCARCGVLALRETRALREVRPDETTVTRARLTWSGWVSPEEER